MVYYFFSFIVLLAIYDTFNHSHSMVLGGLELMS